MPASTPGPLRVAGTVRIQVDDAAGVRPIRTWDIAGGQWRTHELPSLVRSVRVAVDYVVMASGRGGAVTIEVKRSYDSLSDPRVRGETGLGRPDDPQRVAPVKAVVRDLLADCAASFREMVMPVDVTAEVPLRGTWDRGGKAGLDAAGQGDMKAAIYHFRAAAATDPDDSALVFDLAVVAEAAGQLDLARENYRRVVEMSGNRDRQAAEGLDRVERVISRTSPGRR